MNRKWLGVPIAAMTMIIALGCEISSSQTAPNSTDAQIGAPERGGFKGNSPEIFFYVEDGRLVDFKITVPAVTETNRSFDCVIYQNSIRPGYDNKITLASDGSFTYGNTPDPNDQFGFYITGKIEGKTAHGSYIIVVCDPTYSSSNPSHTNRFEGEWSASWFEPTAIPPTRVPIPTAIPPVAGHFEGTNPYVSFNITEGGAITGFKITVGNCSLTQSGTWHLNKYGSFTATANTGMSTIATAISGRVSQKSAAGDYQISVCGSTFLNTPLVGEWQASWVGP